MRKKVLAQEEPKSPISEIFRTLRTNVQFMNSSKGLKTLLVTSTLPGEGKSWVASNLAVTFAQAGQRVILIDADMRKGKLHNMFGVSPYPGLSNYLSGVNENGQDTNSMSTYLRKINVPNLYLIPSGNFPPNPSELLITTRMIDLLDILKEECDLVIIDGTPSLLVTDSIILSRIVDSTLVVVAHNQAKKDDVTKVIRDIKNVGGNIAGVVYNKKPVSAKKVNETYYYASISSKRNNIDYSKLEREDKIETHNSKVIEMLNNRIEEEKKLEQNEVDVK